MNLLLKKIQPFISLIRIKKNGKPGVGFGIYAGISLFSLINLSLPTNLLFWLYSPIYLTLLLIPVSFIYRFFLASKWLDAHHKFHEPAQIASHYLAPTIEGIIRLTTAGCLCRTFNPSHIFDATAAIIEQPYILDSISPKQHNKTLLHISTRLGLRNSTNKGPITCAEVDVLSQYFSLKPTFSTLSKEVQVYLTLSQLINCTETKRPARCCLLPDYVTFFGRPVTQTLADIKAQEADTLVNWLIVKAALKEKYWSHPNRDTPTKQCQPLICQ